MGVAIQEDSISPVYAQVHTRTYLNLVHRREVQASYLYLLKVLHSANRVQS
jgi:hypothetical protein